MEFIKDNSRHTFQRGVALQAAGQNAFGDDLDGGVWACLVVQLDAVAHCFTDGLVQGLRHTSGRGPCCQTTWFQHDNLATLSPGCIQKFQRNPRGFPGTWCGLNNGIRSVLKACTEFR